MINRQDIRAALASILRVEVTDAEVVYDYPRLRLEGQSPVITLASSGSERARSTLKRPQTTAYIEIHVFVLQSGPGWTEEQAENTLDRIEQQIAYAVETHRVTTTWSYLNYDGRSNARLPLTMPGGVVYIHEVIDVKAEVFE